MYVNLKYFLDNKLLDENTDFYLTKIYNKVFETLSDEQKELKKYLETKDDIDGFLNIGVLSKQKYFTPDNVNKVQQAFDTEIDKIKNSDEYQKQIDISNELHSKRTAISKIARIISKFPEAISRTGGALTIYLFFLPALIYTFVIAFQRDLTLYEKLIRTIEKQKERLSKAKDEYDKREEEELQKWAEKREKKELKERKKAEKQAIKEYKNSPEGKKQAILQKIQTLNRSLALCKKSDSRTVHEIDIPRLEAEIASLNSELLTLQ